MSKTMSTKLCKPSTLKQTKANIRWMKVNNQKVNILLENGLNIDEIKVVARYIGSCSNDKRMVCDTCGYIYSLKEHKRREKLYCHEKHPNEMTEEERKIWEIEELRRLDEELDEYCRERDRIFEEDELTFMEKYADY